jgi:hypothetical protein
MTIATDFSVAVNGDIRWTGSSTPNYTVLELHRFLQNLADDAAAAGDDLVDITSSTPSERSTDNIITLLGTYNIDNTAAKHLYDGSITQAGGNTVYSGLKVLGAVNNTATQIQVIQNNTLYDGATPFWGTQATGGYNGNAAAGILMRCLIKSRDSGVDIDGKRVRVQARHWGDTFDFFNATLGQGEAVTALGTTPDAQNTTLQATVTAYTHVTNTEGYQTIDLNNGNGAQPYYSKWTYGANTSGDGMKGVWEFIKDLTGNKTAKTIHGINGELFLGVTHQYDYDGETGTAFVEDDVITWGSGANAGTGLLLALKDNGATGTVWMQLLTGIAPAAEMTVTNEAANGTHVLNGAPITRTIPKVFLGSYTGSVIGAFGIGCLPANLLYTDSVQDLLGVTQIPPNNVTFTVSGLVYPDEDYVLVGPKDTGDGFKFDQLTLQTTLASGSTSVVVSAAIPSDTPLTGTIRVQNNAGVYVRCTYTSWVSSTFTLSGTFGSTATAPKNVWISYIDKQAVDGDEAFTGVYSGVPRSLWIRVRDGGGSPIKTYQGPGTLGISGGSAVASRISDL